MQFIIDNLATIVIAAILTAVLLWNFRYLYKHHKAGKCVGCGSGASCGGACAHCASGGKCGLPQDKQGPQGSVIGQR